MSLADECIKNKKSLLNQADAIGKVSCLIFKFC